jgi:hypothetical protein
MLLQEQHTYNQFGLCAKTAKSRGDATVDDAVVNAIAKAIK